MKFGKEQSHRFRNKLKQVFTFQGVLLLRDQEMRAKKVVHQFLNNLHRAATLNYETRNFAFRILFIKSMIRQIKTLREVRRLFLEKVFVDEINQCKNLCIRIMDRKKNKPKNADEIIAISYKL